MKVGWVLLPDLSLETKEQAAARLFGVRWETDLGYRRWPEHIPEECRDLEIRDTRGGYWRGYAAGDGLLWTDCGMELPGGPYWWRPVPTVMERD